MDWLWRFWFMDVTAWDRHGRGWRSPDTATGGPCGDVTERAALPENAAHPAARLSGWPAETGIRIGYNISDSTTSRTRPMSERLTATPAAIIANL